MVVKKDGQNSSGWRFTGFYGAPRAENRHHSWRFMRTLNAIQHQAWICVGDFNETLYGTEHFSRAARPEWQMRAFREVVDECALQDLGWAGVEYTWDNRQQGAANVKLAWIDLPTPPAARLPLSSPRPRRSPRPSSPPPAAMRHLSRLVAPTGCRSPAHFDSVAARLRATGFDASTPVTGFDAPTPWCHRISSETEPCSHPELTASPRGMSTEKS